MKRAEIDAKYRTWLAENTAYQRSLFGTQRAYFALMDVMSALDEPERAAHWLPHAKARAIMRNRPAAKTLAAVSWRRSVLAAVHKCCKPSVKTKQLLEKANKTASVVCNAVADAHIGKLGKHGFTPTKDLRSAALLLLVSTLHSYMPDLNTNPASYLLAAADRAFQQNRNFDRYNRQVFIRTGTNQSTLRKIEAWQEQRSTPGTPEEVAAALDEPLARVRALWIYAQPVIQEHSLGNVEAARAPVADSAPSAEEQLIRREEADALNEALAQLTPLQRAVVAGAYGLDDNKTMTQIAKEQGIAHKEVREAKLTALAKLRSLLDPGEVNDFSG